MYKSDDLILSIKNLKLAFPKKLYQSSSLRDVFIASMSRSKFPGDNDIHVVLNGVDLQMHRGDRIGIIGKNGAGKSTFCRTISGYYKPPVGSIDVYGTIRALYEASLAFYMELSGRENLKILAEIFYDRNTDDLQALINESIQFSELGEAIDAPLKTYSKGMQVRLTLSLLSAKPCDLLILDEVFDGVDEFFHKKLSERVRNLINKSGSVILVSHQESQILEICNRVLVLRDGKFIFDGPPEEAFKVYRQSEGQGLI